MIKHKKEILSMLTFSYYIKSMPVLVRFLKLSRFPVLKNYGKYILLIQKLLATNIFKYQKVIKQEKNILKDTKVENEDTKRTKKTLMANKHILRILQTICDGIVWRNVNFNRPLLRVFSDNDSSGYLENSDYSNIMSLMCKRGEIIIANDLTRCCRIADYTLITKDKKIILIESKRKGLSLNDITDIYKKIREQKNNIPSSQDQRHIIAQNTIINKKIEIPIFTKQGQVKNDLEVKIIDTDIEIKNYFKLVKKLIKKANKEALVLYEIEDGRIVYIIAHDVIYKSIRKDNKTIKLFDNKLDKFKKEINDWKQKQDGEVVTMSSHDSLIQEKNQYARNVLPYSILPFSSKDCIRMMSGHLEIKYYFNVNKIKNLLENSGWLVEDGSFLKTLKNKNEKQSDFVENKDRVLFKKKFKDEIYKISKPKANGTYSTNVLFTEILVMLSSFYDSNYIVDGRNFLYDNFNTNEENGNSVLSALNYNKEKDILN